MAIVVYQCDTCKRDIEITRNPYGLDTTQNCIITHGCRGNLFQIRLLPDYQRGTFPDDVTGLDNWLQRKVLYNHIQGIERNTWTIIHNLGTFPSVQVLINRPIEGNENNQEEIIPDNIEVVDNNTIKITFSRPWAGSAQLIARQSDPNLINPIVNTPEAVVEPQQISNVGEITIATRISTIGVASNTNVRLIFRTTQGSTPIISYAADDQPALNSPWNDFDTVIINGKLYTVRSFNGITSEMTSGVIGNGSTFSINMIDPDGTQVFRDIVEDEVIILTASTPYTNFDKIVNEYIDVASSTSTFDFFYDTGEFFVQKTIIQSIYPHIRSA